MALSSCFAHPMITHKIEYRSLVHRSHSRTGLDLRFALSPRAVGSETFSLQVAKFGAEVKRAWSFAGGLRIAVRSKAEKFIRSRKSSGVCYSWLANSQIASSVFTLGTVAVLPFYTLMVAAPKNELTKKTMRSSIPYVVLGLLYAYLLWLSWKPDTIHLMFASKYWLPELQGIARMFSNEMTLASAWIHLLVVDLFAARQVYQDGLANEVETRHSVSMCLLFCPIGILSHEITKRMTNSTSKTEHNDSVV